MNNEEFLDDWFKNFTPKKENKDIPFLDDLLDYNEIIDDSNTLYYPCQKCGELSDIYCEAYEFDPDNHYCGKNQWCLP